MPLRFQEKGLSPLGAGVSAARVRTLMLTLLLGSGAMQGCQAGAAPSAQASPASSQEASQGAETQKSASNDETATVNSEDQTPAERESFEQWVNEFRQKARSEGITATTLDEALADVRYQPRIIELDRSQPEFTRAIWEYLDSAVSSSRVDNGRRKLDEHRSAADQAQSRYGVPGSVITAIWGIESNYGGNFGSFSTIDAFATLGYEGRRHAFAQEQLIAALRIIQEGDIDREHMLGSWAGAMGHTQFIPTSFLAYAVDGDNDGRRDIWGSISDVMASTANYLARNGWQRGQPWGVEVRLPDDFDYSRTELSTRQSTSSWQSQGVRAVQGQSLPDFEQASVIAPAGAQGPAFLVGPNFRVIMRYNNATSYALAVALLSQRIDGGPGVQAEWPRDVRPLTRSQTKEMQSLLNQKGFGTGTPDGIMGPNTREGLRAWQRSVGRTPDGFSSTSVLEALRQP
ncbi:lytic murein transglycosylase [Kushneria avicenniae]|uniref:Lytic murein transglycosylase n=1 Tax=Kushneria avicenniae TaxID=402385 RepID=A0A1I1IE52_9GAMM|nr:lytic murein transglycosylase [Kushneria avicenniae]SFC34607.1 lytic murein transglycosylase [Kushneria avicenniae]